MARLWLYPLLILQVLTHLFWLSPAVHSGQVAIPWMMNQGKSLFGDIWEQHAPGSTLLGALAQRLVDIDPAQLAKLLNILLVVALTAIIYLLAKRLTGKEAGGLLAALFWVWWEPVYGNVIFYFDTLLALCVLLAALAYFHQPERMTRRQIIVIGLLLGAATLFKQHAWLAAAAFAIWLLLTERRRDIWLLYGGALLLLPLLQWLALWRLGFLDNYLYWNWAFNLSGLMDGVPLDGDLFRKLLLGNLLVIPYALLALRNEDKRGLLLVLFWLATLSVLYPRFGEIHAMGHLPFAAVMSGVVLAQLLGEFRADRAWDVPRTVLAGLALAIGLGWVWTGAASYLHIPLGPGARLGYDEFAALAAELNARKEDDDTLFLLPETDSTPQLHPMTEMLPPDTWIKGWRWYFQPQVLETLKREWDSEAPTWIVVFPQLTAAGEPGILDLLVLVGDRFQLVTTVDNIYGHGPADIYRLANASE